MILRNVIELIVFLVIVAVVLGLWYLCRKKVKDADGLCGLNHNESDEIGDMMGR